MTGFLDRMPLGPSEGVRALTPDDLYRLGRKPPKGMRHLPQEEAFRYVRTANFDVPADCTKAQLEEAIRTCVTAFLTDLTKQGWTPIRSERVKVYPMGPPAEGRIPFEIKAVCLRREGALVPDAQALTDLLQRTV